MVWKAIKSKRKTEKKNAEQSEGSVERHKSDDFKKEKVSKPCGGKEVI